MTSHARSKQADMRDHLVRFSSGVGSGNMNAPVLASGWTRTADEQGNAIYHNIQTSEVRTQTPTSTKADTGIENKDYQAGHPI